MADRPEPAMRSWPARLAALPILAWRYGVSPVMPPACRYWPSCSEYGLEAVRRHGAARGLWLAGARIARCHPWSGGGIDPVPDTVDGPGAYLGRLLRRREPAAAPTEIHDASRDPTRPPRDGRLPSPHRS
jgi:putative membrane protein insertion efficiency factor